jgi:hypothetical protein
MCSRHLVWDAKFVKHSYYVFTPHFVSDTEFVKHCFFVFNKRYLEMDGPLTRLAFFMDPRFRSAADPYGRGLYQTILMEVISSPSVETK